MIISTRPLIELVPVQPAAMVGRQLCQWDKDSCADAGFLKIDLLGLGMLSAVEDCVEQIARSHDEIIDLSRIPFDDKEVFEDINRADTVGAFQIESRAQMQSLLRTKPENLDDLTAQVALVRQGRSRGRRCIAYIDARERLRGDPSYVFPVDHELLREPLRSTFGVVLFQDQVLEVAIALAGFTVGEAEGLRRAMSRKRSHDALEGYRERFVAGAAEKSVDTRDGRQGFRQACRLLRLQLPQGARGRVRASRLPIAMASASLPGGVPLCTLERSADGLLPACDARSRCAATGVEVHPADVNVSAARCTIEEGQTPARFYPVCHRHRYQLHRLCRRGRGRSARRGAGRKQAFRRCGGSRSQSIDLAWRAPVSLVKSGACDGFGRPRRDLLWELGLIFRAQSVPGPGERRSSSRSPSSRPPRRHSYAISRAGSACSRTTGTRGCRSERTRSHSCAHICLPERSRAWSFTKSGTACVWRSPG